MVGLKKHNSAKNFEAKLGKCFVKSFMIILNQTHLKNTSKEPENVKISSGAQVAVTHRFS